MANSSLLLTLTEDACEVSAVPFLRDNNNDLVTILLKAEGGVVLSERQTALVKAGHLLASQARSRPPGPGDEGRRWAKTERLGRADGAPLGLRSSPVVPMGHQLPWSQALDMLWTQSPQVKGA